MLLGVALVVGGLTALTTSALAGAGESATVAKKKKKKCPAGTHKVVTKKKNGKKKTTCAADPALTQPPAGPAPATTLSISATTFHYTDTQHGACTAPPDADCQIHTFTITNTGGAASGTPATTIAETNNPIPGDPAGFAVYTNSCTAAIPAGGTCAVSVYFRPTSNAIPQPYTAVLHVAASPGSDVQASLSGTGT